MKKFLAMLEDGEVFFVKYQTKFVDRDEIRYYVDEDDDVVAYDPIEKEIFIPNLSSALRLKVKYIMNPVKVAKKNVRKTN